jgi:Ca-activated chloride channel homolog
MMEGPATLAATARRPGEPFMKSVASGVAFLFVTAAMALFSLAAPMAQQPTLRSGARSVAVYATVTDRDGRLVPDLERDAFEVRDNGKPQPITVFSNEIQPITVVVMLDRSGSMRGNFGLVARAAEEFVARLRPDDKARIGSFAERIDIGPDEFTSDQQELLGILRSDLPVTGPTPLWNAMDDAIAAVRGQEGRKVVLVFSDGGDAPNFGLKNRSIMDVMRGAQQDDVMVYAIGLQTTVIRRPSGRGGIGGLTGSMTSMRPDPGLAAIADDTGGGYFELTRADDLASTFARVADELHRQYLLGFEPPRLDDKMHKLDVRVNQRGSKVRARKEYFASRQANGVSSR